MGNAGQGISESGFLAVLWTLTGLATVLFFGRLLIRSVLVKTFHLDDVFGAVAWFVTTVAIILATIANPLNYKSGAIVVGEIPKPPLPELIDITITLRKWNVADQVLFWIGLYSSKLSFLFLYRVIFGSHSAYRYTWFAALTYVVLSFGICLIGVFGQCGDVHNLFSYEKCMTPYVAHLDAKLIWVDFFFNITSDIAVAILPLPMIWGLNMHIKQKLAVTGIFGLAAVTVAFETLRTVKLYSEDFTLTNLYSYLELVIAVLLSMLPSYRFLVSPTDKDREYRRLFWSRMTLRSYHSASSDNSMQTLGRRQSNQSGRVGDSRERDQEPESSLPVANPV
ncbi:hypothetical protein F5Y10DRAFT_279206 [Nemania abortiva]|nr:hypothetical protein F5Y10DRAFT_279206 [Nemania abortiva]